MQTQTNIILELLFRSRCRHSCSLQFKGGRIADKSDFGNYFDLIADADTEKYNFRTMSTMNSDKWYVTQLREPFVGILIFFFVIFFFFIFFSFFSSFSFFSPQNQHFRPQNRHLSSQTGIKKRTKPALKGPNRPLTEALGELCLNFY